MYVFRVCKHFTQNKSVWQFSRAASQWTTKTTSSTKKIDIGIILLVVSCFVCHLVRSFVHSFVLHSLNMCVCENLYQSNLLFVYLFLVFLFSYRLILMIVYLQFLYKYCYRCCVDVDFGWFSKLHFKLNVLHFVCCYKWIASNSYMKNTLNLISIYDNSVVFKLKKK